MINSLQGTISGKNGDLLYLDVGGIEWEIAVPVNDLAKFSPIGSTSRILVWLYHRDDQMRLFGFFDEQRRRTFLELIKVSGIGPRQAIRFMGGLSQQDLEQALESDDTSRLEAVPGLGKKTAQKMILALKGRLVGLNSSSTEPVKYQELLDALTNMGFDRKAALTALEKVSAAKSDTELSESELFKQAIMELSGL